MGDSEALVVRILTDVEAFVLAVDHADPAAVRATEGAGGVARGLADLLEHVERLPVDDGDGA